MELGLAPTQSHSDFKAMLAQAKLAECCGFTMLWAHEHHSAGMMYPDPIMALAAMAQCTQTIGLGTNMLLLPIHHPVRVAQSGAMLDVLSGGRFCLGVANGYSATDLQTFGIGHQQRGARLTEGIELIRALWRGDAVTCRGIDFDLNGFQLFPLPVQKPMPRIYVGGHAEIAIRRAARLGDHYLISTTTAKSALPGMIASYHQALEAQGHAPQDVALNRIVCAVRNGREKRVATEFFARALIALYDNWGYSAITSLEQSARSTAALAESNFIIGEPDECLDQLHEYGALGVTHVACLTSFGGPEAAWVENSTRLIGDKVIPHLNRPND